MKEPTPPPLREIPDGCAVYAFAIVTCFGTLLAVVAAMAVLT